MLSLPPDTSLVLVFHVLKPAGAYSWTILFLAPAPSVGLVFFGTTFFAGTLPLPLVFFARFAGGGEVLGSLAVKSSSSGDGSGEGFDALFIIARFAGGGEGLISIGSMAESSSGSGDGSGNGVDTLFLFAMVFFVRFAGGGEELSSIESIAAFFFGLHAAAGGGVDALFLFTIVALRELS